MKKILLFSVIFVALLITAEAIPGKRARPKAPAVTKGRDVPKPRPGQGGQVPVEPDFPMENLRSRI
uniref:5 kDa salivary protein n=1 Tax=Phlebotomus ariasi TaxID=59272 RepID=Q2TJF3_9DIPT|nr:5 kDa salivary protein [Phlebotomus ariasi]